MTRPYLSCALLWTEKVIAEAHFDGSRNMVAMISGVRRWIMAHPNQCGSMYLLQNGHPSGRHSAVDWSKPDLETYPDFPQARFFEDDAPTGIRMFW